MLSGAPRNCCTCCVIGSKQPNSPSAVSCCHKAERPLSSSLARTIHRNRANGSDTRLKSLRIANRRHKSMEGLCARRPSEFGPNPGMIPSSWPSSSIVDDALGAAAGFGCTRTSTRPMTPPTNAMSSLRQAIALTMSALSRSDDPSEREPTPWDAPLWACYFAGLMRMRSLRWAMGWRITGRSSDDLPNCGWNLLSFPSLVARAWPCSACVPFSDQAHTRSVLVLSASSLLIVLLLDADVELPEADPLKLPRRYSPPSAPVRCMVSADGWASGCSWASATANTVLPESDTVQARTLRASTVVKRLPRWPLCADA